MKCVFRTANDDFKICNRCRRVVRSKSPPERIVAICRVSSLFDSDLDAIAAQSLRPIKQPAPQGGPGTELHRLVAQLGVRPDASCNCEAWRLRMNAWGSEGCKEHREEILAHLRSAYSKTDWPTVFAAALAGAAHLWLVRRINPLRPIESGLNALLDEAIERAEQRAT